MLREFKDTKGVKWRVWDVRPASPMIDRRLVLRRIAQDEEYAGVERRQQQRRVLPGEHMSDGWLAFDSVVGRRRMMSIPQSWTEADDASLCEWCEAADEAEPRLEWGRSVEF